MTQCPYNRIEDETQPETRDHTLTSPLILVRGGLLEDRAPIPRLHFWPFVFRPGSRPSGCHTRGTHSSSPVPVPVPSEVSPSPLRFPCLGSSQRGAVVEWVLVSLLSRFPLTRRIPSYCRPSVMTPRQPTSVGGRPYRGGTSVGLSKTSRQSRLGSEPVSQGPGLGGRVDRTNTGPTRPEVVHGSVSGTGHGPRYDTYLCE